MQNHLEISCNQIDNHLKDTQNENRRLQEQLNQAQQKIQVLEEDLTQHRAHLDLFNIQLEETSQERDHFKVLLLITTALLQIYLQICPFPRYHCIEIVTISNCYCMISRTSCVTNRSPS